MFRRPIASLLVALFALCLCGPAVAGIFGTTDGTYDFSDGNTATNGNIGADDSAGTGFATFSDKFFLSNGMLIDDIVLTSIWTGSQMVADTYGTFKVKAEGGSTCKSFTFKDLAIHDYDGSTTLSEISVTTKDQNGVIIATHSGSVSFSSTSITQLSTLINGGSQFNDSNVALIEITWRFLGSPSWPAPSNLNFDNITIANVSAAPVPTVTTNAATAISPTGATLNGTVNPNGYSTVVTFDYGTTTSYGSSATASQSPLTGSTATAVSAAVSGLTCGTTYHFRAKGVNSGGTTYGSDATFTPPCNTAPSFVGSTTTLSLDQNAGATDIRGLLHVSDTDASQTETWSQNAAPNHGGTLVFSGATASSGSTDITPGGTITYQPASGYAGTETFTVQVSDGTASATRTITASVAPAASTATAATSITASGFSANWGSVTGATGYYLDVATDSGFTGLVTGYSNKDVGNVVTSAVSGLSASTTYYYRVRAYAGTVTGADSNSITVLTLPGAATATAATSVTTSGFSANWGSVTGATGYYLDVATDSGFTSLVTGYNNKDVGNVVTAAVSGLSAGTTYYYRVRAYNASGTGADSNSITVLTLPGAATATAATSVTDSGFSANWGSVTGATGYYLDVATDSGFTSPVTGYSNKDVGSVVTAAVSGLSAGTTYYYRVRAYNASGTGADSNSITALTLPGAVTATAATSVTASGFSANWGSVTGATGYYLDVATDSGFTSLVIGYSNLDVGNVVTAAVSGLSAGTTYYYRLRAYNTSGSGADSNSITALTLPAAPVATAATSVTASGFSANWGSVTGATGYYLDVATDSGFTSLVTGYVNKDVGNVTSAAVTGLSAGTTYYYRVRAVNASGTGADSNSITALTLPAAPVATVASAVSFTGFTANWGSVTGATGYYLDVATDSGFTSLVTGYGNKDVGNLTSAAVTGLSSATPYHYRVRAYNTSGTGADSNTISQTTATTLVVTSAGDSDAGSLRQTIASAAPGDAITFAAGLSGQTITLATQLVIDKDLTISGPGAGSLIVSGSSTRILQVSAGSTLILQYLTLTGGIADNGGALLADSGTTTTITGCVFSANTATASGGAIYSGGAMTVSDTLLSGNSAVYGGAISSSGALALTNVTLAANSASSGGGLYNAASGTATLLNATIAGNSAAVRGGGAENAGTLTFKNTIIADNSAPTGPEIYGSVTSQGYNLIRVTTDAVIGGDTTGNITGQNPLLGTLANNGGPSFTMALLSGSPAIGAGTCTGAPTADQRGMARPQNVTCDMGAYERGAAAALTATSGTPQSTVINTAFTNPLTARVADALGGLLDGISVTFTGPGSGAGIAAGGSVASNTAGSAAFSATANGLAGSYTVAAATGALSATYSLTNDKAAQVITFNPPASATYGDGPITLSATGGASGNPVTFAVTSGPGSLSGTILTITGAGTIVVTASQAGSADYFAAADVVRSIVVAKATATVTLTPASLSVTYDGSPKAAAVTTVPAGLTVAVTYDGSATAPTAVGSYAVVATVSDANYLGSASGTLVIGKVSQTIGAIGVTPSAPAVGESATLSATATSGLTVTFSSQTPAFCTVSGVTVTGVAAGTCTVAVDQAGDAIYNGATQVTQNLTIAKGSQTIGTIGITPSTLAVGDSATLSAIATSGLTVTFSSQTPSICTVSGTTINGLATGDCIVAANQAGDANYLAAPQVTRTIAVAIPLSLTVSTLADGAVTAAATLNVSGTVSNPARLATLTINGVNVTVAGDGSFSYPLQLLAGANSIVVIATSTSSDIISDSRTITLDATALALTIAAPADQAVVNLAFATVSGTVAETATGVGCSVNGGSLQAASIAGTTWSCTVNLAAGMNTVLVMATGSSGATSQAKRTVTFQPAFSLAVSAPSSDIRTVMGSYLLQGAVSGNSTPVTVTVTMDGQSYTPAVDGTTGAFQQQLAFGSNKVYMVSIAAADQSGNTVTVQRNIMAIATESDPLTIVDALQSLQATVGLNSLTGSQISRLDVAPMVNGASVGDGVIDIEDVIIILRKAVGLL
ncbi:MAG: hypothetical protein GJT30_09295 [Geobacter sp.]|nr:hypothetical protein [Geobacter sp.]